MKLRFVLCAAWTMLIPPIANAQLLSPQKISATEGGFEGELQDRDGFGFALANLGDVDDDGVTDLAVGTPGIGGAGTEPGGAWILFLTSGGTVKNQIRVPRPSQAGAHFGGSLAGIGDVDGDGIKDLSATSNLKHWIFLLNPDGSIKSTDERRCSTGTASGRPSTCSSVALPDVDGDGVNDLARGNPRDGSVSLFQLDGDSNTPWLTLDGTTHPEFGSSFGSSLALVDSSDNMVLAVGAPDAETVWLLSFNRFENGADNWFKEAHPIDVNSPGLSELAPNDRFGTALSAVGDLDRNGTVDLAVGAPRSGQDGAGATWLLFLEDDRSVLGATKISPATHGLESVNANDQLGNSVVSLGDLNEDGFEDLAIGAPYSNDGGEDRGAVWIVPNLSSLPASVEILEPSGDGPFPVETDIVVRARMTAVGGIADPNVSFRRGGDLRELADFPMRRESDGTFRSSIPDYAVSGRGIEFLVNAENVEGLKTVTSLRSLRVRVGGGYDRFVEGGSSSAAYRLFSVPGQLDNPSALTLLEDDLGRYDPTDWRFFGLNDLGQLVELGDQDLSIVPGSAFLLISRGNARVNTGAVTSVGTVDPYPIPVSSGWNLIGNPYNFSIPVGSLSTQRGQAILLFSHRGSWSEVTDVIEPFEGYAFKSSGSDTLLIDTDLSNSNTGATTVGVAEAGLEQLRLELESLFGNLEAPPATGRMVESVSVYPNPFVASTTFRFELRETSDVRLTIHDILGRRVAAVVLDANQGVGQHTAVWDGRGQSGDIVASGTYFFRLVANGSEKTGTVMIAR